MDGKVYALDTMTGMVKSRLPGEHHVPEPNAERNRVFGSVGIGNFDGQGPPDILVVSNARAPGENNSGSLYIVHSNGNNHPGGPFHANYPLVPTSLNFFPLVGEGMSSAPPIAEASTATAATSTCPAATGSRIPTHPPRGPATRAAAPADDGPRGHRDDPRGLPRNHSRTTSLSSSPSRRSSASRPSATSTATAALTTSPRAPSSPSRSASRAAAAGDFSRLIGAWSGRTGQVLPGFPQVIEDYTFFHNPTIASVDGDPYPEVIVATAGYYVHAFNACGREAPGFPKFTGQWTLRPPPSAT